ncbi:hypothetical protein ACFLQI_01535 [Candidatus Undinarchaeota archaeon]
MAEKKKPTIAGMIVGAILILMGLGGFAYFGLYGYAAIMSLVFGGSLWATLYFLVGSILSIIMFFFFFHYASFSLKDKRISPWLALMKYLKSKK